VPFLLLGMELPPTPLFKDALEKNIIPQVRAFLLYWLQGLRSVVTDSCDCCEPEHLGACTL
jgi:hypothetical protein